MPTGKPKRGYRRTKKLEQRTLAEIEKELTFRVPDLLKRLEELTKVSYCPSCGNPVHGVDRDAIIYLIDRAMGKPKQTQTLDITHTIQLSADEIDSLLERHFDGIVALIEQRYPRVRGLLTQGEANTSDK